MYSSKDIPFVLNYYGHTLKGIIALKYYGHKSWKELLLCCVSAVVWFKLGRGSDLHVACRWASHTNYIVFVEWFHCLQFLTYIHLWINSAIVFLTDISPNARWWENTWFLHFDLHGLKNGHRTQPMDGMVISIDRRCTDRSRVRK
jgi:hypothetical protein